MKKYLILIMCLFFTSNIFAQEAKNSGKIGVEYGFEKVFNEDEYCISQVLFNRMYFADYVNHKISILYKQPLIGNLYIEPRIFYYQFTCDFDYSFSYIPEYEGFKESVLSHVKDVGLGGSINLGYNILICKKFSVDVYLAPDYRYSIKCKNTKGKNLLNNDQWYDHPIYKRSYFQAKAGVGLNYGNISLNIDYGKYLTDRLLINKDAAMPKVLSFALGYKFK